jgi:hypothetical protein
MSCYTAELLDLLEEAGVPDTPAARERLDRAVRATLGFGTDAGCDEVSAAARSRRDELGFRGDVLGMLGADE